MVSIIIYLLIYSKSNLFGYPFTLYLFVKIKPLYRLTQLPDSWQNRLFDSGTARKDPGVKFLPNVKSFSKLFFQGILLIMTEIHDHNNLQDIIPLQLLETVA